VKSLLEKLGIKVVVFDVDDTVYLERDYVKSGFHAIESEYGLPGFERMAWDLFLEGARGDTIERALDRLGIESPIEFVGKLVATYRSHLPTISLQNDAVPVLTKLLERHVPVGVVTDGPLVSQTRKVEVLGLRKFAELVVYTDSYGEEYSKPHPRSFEEIQLATGISSWSHIYVADNPLKDFAGPSALGWRTLRVRRPLSLHVEAETPDYVDFESANLRQLVEEML
jgi:putative hydrolase of the HAD superfamily